MRETVGQRVLQYGLGILWLLDGLLQSQPLMFTTDFYALYPPNIMESLLQSATDGQPAWLAHLMELGIRMWAYAPVLFNIGAVVLQVAIGLCLLIGRSRKFIRAGLWVSIIWGIVIWIFGEGLGGLLADSPNYWDGFPGAAALYVIGAIFLLLPDKHWHSGLAARILQAGMGMYWLAMSIFQALPSSGYWNSDALATQMANAASLPQPHFLSAPIESFVYLTGDQPVLWNAILTLVLLLLAAVYLSGGFSRGVLWLSMLWLFWSWWFGQDFGGIFSGMGTDFNSIPVLALFTLAAWNVDGGTAAAKPAVLKIRFR
ncbi:hypothetical protein [Ferviditalea candida]|uniref:Uncharacterized protein n=1 Tax=Ferviditalea candida TaxID=3108399 RepID=A0ABU5ZLV5_9BACL|nr:hypothetical protein [Paenibacillaceae bacterium T2]